MSVRTLAVAAMIAAVVTAAGAARADDHYLGEIRTFGMTECPPGWLPTDGRLLQIADHGLLHALIGDVYGGDNRRTFALPHLAPLKGAPDRLEIRCIAVSGIYHRF